VLERSVGRAAGQSSEWTSELNSAVPSMSSLSFDLDQQQQLVYASLMRFGSETISRRHRCLDHLVLNGLLGSSVKTAMKIGELQAKLHLGTHAPVLRPEILRETLLRLEQEGMVAFAVVKKKRLCYLTESGVQQMDSAVVSAESLFKPVLANLLANTQHLVPTDIGVKLCTDLLCEAFARCGLAIAKNFQGRTAFPHSGDLAAAFDAAVSRWSISSEARQTLEVRCLALFKSRDLDQFFTLRKGTTSLNFSGLITQLSTPSPNMPS
jgi:hypothetical protein